MAVEGKVHPDRLAAAIAVRYFVRECLKGTPTLHLIAIFIAVKTTESVIKHCFRTDRAWFRVPDINRVPRTN